MGGGSRNEGRVVRDVNEGTLVKLNYYDNSWPLTLTDYPCDLHFVQWLESKKIEGKVIFHFGTGEHHLVGKNNHDRGNPNEIMGIAASRKEHGAYIDFIVDNPGAANYYRVLFGDIYTLSPRMLPKFDIVTLFHLCEYYDKTGHGTGDWEKGKGDGEPGTGARGAGIAGEPEIRLNSAYARLNDRKLLELFLSRLNQGGKILFFKQSGAYGRDNTKAADLVNDFVYRKRMVIDEEYETLLVCLRPW